MALNVKDKAQSFASLGSSAVDKITDALLSVANSKLAELIGGELYAKYSKPITADTISSITLGSRTMITISSAHYRRTGSYVYLYGIIDNGLWQLNGRHEIEYVEGSGALSFYIDIDTSSYENVAYTSGGKVIDGIVDEIQDAEAFLLLWYLIPTCIDIKKGDIGVIPQTIEYGEGNATKSFMDELDKLANGFYEKAISIIKKNLGDGDTSDRPVIVAI